MKKTIVLLFLAIKMSYSVAQNVYSPVVTTDIDNFWMAYDKIIKTQDTTEQVNIFNALYLDKASDGLKTLIRHKNYTTKEYLDGICQYPLFWASIRPNMMQLKEKIATIDENINKFKSIYPDMQAKSIYFTVGAFRTSGYVREQKVLIGAEMAATDKSVNFSELPERFHFYYKNYSNALDEIGILCRHEYVHTQQNEVIDNLLSYCIFEGVAEFVSTKALNVSSNTPAIEFGKKNAEKIKAKFEREMFINGTVGQWLWSSDKNEFDMRDLGYYIGYSICEKHYEMAKDKKKAIKEMIELDYKNESKIEDFVDKTHFFSASLNKLYKRYEKSRPKVTSISPFKNGSKNVKPGLTKITVHFSEALNGHNTGLDFGTLGETAFPKITPQSKIWSADGKSWTFEANLEPNKHYQILISNNFRLKNNVRLKAYLLDFTTTE